MLDRRRKALAFSLGWWLLRRRLRKRAGGAVLGLLAGEGLSAVAPRKRGHRVRNLLLVAGLLAGGALVWKRLRGGGEDWGTWEPEPPGPAPAAASDAGGPASATARA